MSDFITNRDRKFFFNIIKSILQKAQNTPFLGGYFYFSIYSVIFYTIKMQFKSMGIIIKNTKNRSVKGADKYWMLTPYGDTVTTCSIAMKIGKK